MYAVIPSKTLVILLLILSAVHLSCSDSKKVEEAKEGIKVAQEEQKAVVEYPNLYCQEVVKLKTRSDISPEINYLCKDGAPTQEMLYFRQKAIDNQGNIELVVVKSVHDEATFNSEFMVVWSFHVPIRPFEVKGRPLYEFITKDYKSDGVDLKIKNQKQADNTLDPGGLHLWSVNMNYDLAVKATGTLELTNQRNTQYNLYQVQSGNEEMGLGVEALADPENETYAVSNMVNFSFNDGKGYNDGNGGTIVINILRFQMNNQGFPQTLSSSVEEIANFLANQMYNGLKQ